MTKAKDHTGPVVVCFQSEHRIFEACSTEKDPPRPVLAGVFVDAATGYLVGSNSYVLAAVPFSLVEGSTFPRGFKGCVVPGSVLREGYKAHPGQGVSIPLYLDLEAKTAWTENKTGGSTAAQFIQGCYPPWQQFIPPRRTLGNRKVQTYDVGSLSRIFQATGLNKAGPVQLSKDSGPGLVVGTDGAFGLLMPSHSAEPEAKALNTIFRLRPRVKPALKAAA